MRNAYLSHHSNNSYPIKVKVSSTPLPHVLLSLTSSLIILSYVLGKQGEAKIFGIPSNVNGKVMLFLYIGKVPPPPKTFYF